MKDFDYVKINSINPLYLIIGKADGYIEKSNENKYLLFASTNKNKEVLTKYTKLWDEIKHLIKTNGGDAGEYEKEYMKIKFNSDYDLPLNKKVKLHNLTIVVRIKQPKAVKTNIYILARSFVNYFSHFQAIIL